ncbi:MAG: thymidine phosphorylase [Bacillota bacterium]|nr:thymidine phosphorylase [Bacillota bacterium]
MNTIDIVAKKRDGLRLSEEELAFIIRGCVDSSITDYQLAAFLMAVRIRGLDLEETVNLTKLMAESGDIMCFGDLPGIKADKHSTGGVGDKTSLIVMPIVSAAGLIAAKMSGRGLGHTGGTLDKLDSIPGFRCSLSRDEFLQQLEQIGIALVSQSGELAPADKVLYALRDVTATVDSLPLIAASIMSKKLAMSADVLVLDVKYGSGAMLPLLEEGRELAELMVGIATRRGIRASAVLSSMEQPLGRAVGNALEVQEVLEVLRGEGPPDLRELCLVLAGEQLYLSGRCASPEEAKELAAEVLDSGKAYARFCEMVRAQGGNDDFSQLPQAELVVEYRAKREGYLASFDTAGLGRAAVLLGAGRQRKEDVLDYGAGFLLHHKVGDRLKQGDLLLEIHGHDEAAILEVCKRLDSCIHIGDECPPLPALVVGLIRP